MKIINEVRRYLSSLPPLSVTTTRRIYAALSINNPNINYDYLRAAVQRVSLGSTRVDSQRTGIYYAIFLKLEEMRHIKSREDVYLSLNGIERAYIENMSRIYIKSIKSKLAKAYNSNEAIYYWVQSTQLNSMSRIKNQEMLFVRQRENDKCRICAEIETAFIQADKDLPVSISQNLHKGKLKVCHIISRSSVFWHLLAQVHDENLGIFTDAGVLRFKSLLKSNPLHSSSRYMVLLCHKHDSVVQNSLKNV